MGHLSSSAAGAADGGVAGGFSSVGGVGDWAPRGNNQMHILNRMLTSHGHFPFGETRLVKPSW